MTATYDDSTGNGSNLNFNYTFPILQTEDVKVALNSVVQATTKYTVNTSANPTRIEFNNTLVDSALQESTGAPKSGILVRVFRETTVGKASGDDDPKAVYAAGSSIRAVDLNANTEQALYAIHELQEQEINGLEITEGTVTSTTIQDGTITNIDISPTAEIEVSKLGDGTARQLLQTAANGTDVEWTSNVDIPGTLDVTGTATFDGNVTTVGTTTTGLLNSGDATLSGTLGVAGAIDANGGATIDDIQIGVSANNEIDTSTGNLIIDSAGGTTTVDDNLVVTGTLNVTGNSQFSGDLNVNGAITGGTIDATLLSGFGIDLFWLTNKQHINHIGETITLGKSSTGTGSSFQVNNAAHSFNIAKNYTFNVGKYVNEGQTFGNFGGLSYQPCFQVQHQLNIPRVTKIGSTNYTVSNVDEKGYINLGTGQSSWINSNTNLHNTQVHHSNLVLSGIRGNSSSSAISNPNNYCPDVVLHPQRGVMFTHPDNVSETYTYSSDPNYVYSALNSVANGAYTQGVFFPGDPAGWGNNGYLDASECLTKLEAAVDFQIIVGGARAKNRFEIGSSSVAGTLSLSGQDVTATGNELNVLDGYTGNTSELNKLHGFTGTTTDLNEVVAGKNVVEQITSSAADTELPTAQAVNERIVELVTEVGGFHPIADETSFPTTNPDINDGAGTIVSIANAAGLKVANGSGSGTYAGTAGNSIGATTTAGTAVTITGIDSSLHGTTIAGKGMLVETTSTLNEYTYHRLVVDEAGVASAQAAIDDFDERYYGPHAANQATRPSGANRLNGDLYFNTSDGKMKVFNGVHATGTWDDVAAPGNFFINTLSLSSGSGGNSATFNNNATRFTLSNPPLTAEQLLVSVNGVIQKPNSGTSPSEGFAIDGADIIFASAPATGAPFFIVTIGSSVNIGTPSNNTVGADQIIDGSISNAEISSSAAIAGSKISPDFGSQVITTTGNTSVGETLTVTGNDPNITFTDTSTNPDYKIYANAGNFSILDSTNSATRFLINSSGNIVAGGNLTIGGDLTIDTNTLHVDSTNNRVGIGTTSPLTDAELTISAADTPALAFQRSGSGKFETAIAIESGHFVFKAGADSSTVAGLSDVMKIESTGNLGIGVASPSGPLHVYKSSGASRSYFESGDSHTFIRLLGGSASHNSGIEFFSGSSTNTANITATSTSALQFDVGSTNAAMYINSSGSVGIGTTSPQANLDLVDTNASLLVRPSDGNAGEARLYLGGGGADQLKSAIIFDPSGGYCRGDLKFCVENTADTSNVDSTDAKLTIQAAGDVAIGNNDFENIPLHVKGKTGQTTILKIKSTETTVNQQWMQSGNANMLHQYDGLSFNTYTPSASGTLELQHQINHHGITLTQGKGINFYNYGQGTNIDSNQLNDYEEGTWSPALTASSGSYTTTPTMSISNARYTKIGRQVFCEAYIQFSNNGAGGGGYQILTGLPFTVNSSQTYSGVYYGWHDLNDALLNEHENLHGYVQNGNTYVVFYKTNSNGNNNTLDTNTFSNGVGGNMQINFHYTIA